MRLIAKLVVVALGILFAAPALAQTFDRPASCEAALANLEAVRTGKQPPSGIWEGLFRLKATGAYAAADTPAFALDAYREHADVRALCPPAKWPADVSSAGLKSALAAGVKTNKPIYCGKGAGWEDGPNLILKLTSKAGIDGFSDRIKELQGKLEPTARSQSAARHSADYEWFFEAAEDMVDACGRGSDLNPAIASTSAKSARDFAKDNVAFLGCIKLREPALKGPVADFDAAAKAGDQAKMQELLAKLEAAAAPVRPACAPSKEATMEMDYILAAKKLQILFLTTPGCRDAAVKMNDDRQEIGRDRDHRSIDYHATQLRQDAKDAAAICKDPAAQTWGEFIAWISQRNEFRLAELDGKY